ncbi:MAG: ATP-binding protein [Aggregatilineales bacterium]
MLDTLQRLHFRIQAVTDVSDSRRKGMQLALDMGFAHADATKIAVVISELARNILIYAKTGTVTVLADKDPDGARCIKIIADDRGPGIPHLEQAMTDGYSTSGGLGLGLSGSKRLMDEFFVHSQVNRGTTVTAVKYLR